MNIFNLRRHLFPVIILHNNIIQLLLLLYSLYVPKAPFCNTGLYSFHKMLNYMTISVIFYIKAIRLLGKVSTEKKMIGAFGAKMFLDRLSYTRSRINKVHKLLTVKALLTTKSIYIRSKHSSVIFSQSIKETAFYEVTFVDENQK